MESLLYFLLAALIFYLMMGMGRWVHARRGQQPRGRRYREGADEEYWVPPQKDRDPVCRKIIQTQGAKSCVHQDKAYYFCSRECREAFEAAPAIYLPENAAAATGAREHAHV